LSIVIPAKAGIACIQDDELAEVTPRSIRLRTRYPVAGNEASAKTSHNISLCVRFE
jgi:predicted membrane GTPase involved in stress response